jgi:hypothetical protein
MNMDCRLKACSLRVYLKLDYFRESMVMLELIGFLSVRLWRLEAFKPYFLVEDGEGMGIFYLLVNLVYYLTIRSLSRSSKSRMRWLTSPSF